jgi:hypothetical protein
MTDHKDEHKRDESQSASKAYETRDVRIRPLLVFAAGLTVVGVVVYLVIFVMIRLFSGQAAKEDALLAPSSLAQPAAPGEERLPPEPRIQVNPAGDLKMLRDREDAILTTYGWVDRTAGVVRVPVDVAMKLVLEEGLPVRQPEGALPAAGTPAPRKPPQGQTKKGPQ